MYRNKFIINQNDDEYSETVLIIYSCRLDKLTREIMTQ